MVLIELATLIVGIALVAYSSEKTVEHSIKIAAAFRVPTLIIGVVLVSVGTDLPEITNSILSSYTGHGDINVGNILGSCLTQISLILAFVAILGGVVKGHRRNVIILGACAVAAVAVAAIVVMDGELSRVDAAILIVTYAILLFIATRFSVREVKTTKIDIYCVERNVRKCLAMLFLAVIGVVIGAAVVVNSVIALSQDLGLPEYFISFFIVGIGTSLPELSVELAAIRKRQYGLMLGDLMGSNITDATLALGIGPLLFPTAVSAGVIFPLAFYVVAASVAVVVLFAWRGKIDRKAAVALLAIYFLSFIFAR
jgi:cation:H+ antiporter